MQFLNDEFAVTNIIHEAFMKAWEHRQTMESIRHVYFFIKMNMKWHLQKHYGNAKYRFYRNTFLMEFPEKTLSDYSEADMENEQQQQIKDEKRIEDIYKVIPYLPPTLKNIMLLHFKYGLSYTAIARKYGTSYQKVSTELEKSIHEIKKMTLASNRKKQKIPLKNSIVVLSKNEQKIQGTPEEILNLRTNQNMSFDEIAQLIGESRATTLRLFVEAKTIKK